MLRDSGCGRGATGRQTHGLLQLERRVFVADRTYNVLFLCTGNSARSIMAEAILNRVGAGRFRAFSAGSHPTGTVNPFALELLRASRIPVDGLRSKGWDEFAKAPGARPFQAGQPPDWGRRASASAPPLDFVFTVCDNAAGEVCPVWPGQPVTAHWGVPDPAAVTGSDEEKRHAFSETCRLLVNRIRVFTSLPIAKLDRLALKKKLDDIGKEG